MRPRRSRMPGGISEEIRRRHSWLELLQTSGPFLTLPVVHRVFPNGLAPVPVHQRARLRGLVAAMLDDRGASRHTVIETLLRDALDWQQHLRIDAGLPQSLAEVVAEHGVLVRPDFGFYAEGSGDDTDDDEEEQDEDDSPDEQDSPGSETAAGTTGRGGPWKLLGCYLPWGSHPLARTTVGGWTASPVERLAVLLRARDVPVGLVTDGRWWALVWAPRRGATGAAVWDASLFSEEPAALQALAGLLQRSRFLAAAPPDRLPALLAESLERQEEVTETLGRQVREAVEMLVTTLDRLDRESGGSLLAGVDDDDLYAGVVTVMMRVVFLLFAEERRLLPSDDNLYVTAYSVGHLVDQLDQQASLAGEQTLEYRTAAWHRLLALTRAVSAGVAHEDLRLPAYGGGLFDPDRYPWLEGRAPGDPATAARPPAVDDRTVLRMLRAVQYVNISGKRRRLTFRALDVEQIGYVYEGLLELEVRTAAAPVLGLARPSGWPQRIKYDAEVTLPEASARLGAAALAGWLAERTGWTAKRTQAALDKPSDSERVAALRRAAGNDSALTRAITPFLGVLRDDERGLPVLALPGGRYVTRSSRRAATGTHYTPRALAEEVAEGALQPLVYRPGPLETGDQARWRPRPSDQILALRVADIAMGSGAFLVAACRYLADKLVEAWQAEGRADALAAARHQEAGRAGADAETEGILLDARRLVAEHCLYGVDINPLAVEMAKLSLWLITMDRERPFGFLDDRLVHGDSLLGLTDPQQLEELHLIPADGRRLHDGTLDFADGWRSRLQQAADLRRRITAHPVTEIRDIEHKARLLAEAVELSGTLTAAADAVTATGLAAAKLQGKKCDGAFLALSIRVANSLDDPAGLEKWAQPTLQAGKPPGIVDREPLHWPLAFPEVFADAAQPGFDAILGNPPFLAGSRISGILGEDYAAWLQRWDGCGVAGNTDLAARFVLRAERLTARRGQLGFVATNTLVEGTTLRVGLEQVVKRGLAIRAGRSPHPWPTISANLQIVEFWASGVPLSKEAIFWLDGEDVPAIGPDLEPYGRVRQRPSRLRENNGVSFHGSRIEGLGFTLSFAQRDELIDREPRDIDVLQPYIIGRDLNQRPDCSASRWVINFRDWSLDRSKEYPSCLEIVRRLVKPERERNKRTNYREYWWRYGEHRPGLYEAIDRFSHVLAIARVSNALAPARVPTGPVFSEQIVIFALEDFASLALLSSSVHSIWVIRYTSTMRTDIRYAASDVFLTLPRPQSTAELHILGKDLDETRREIMLSRAWGLTTTYNRVHDPDCHDPAIRQLRGIHEEVDEAVLRAYGWNDIELKFGHHPTKIGMRWTVGKEARFELLDRLLEENHRRHAEENP
jgi:hypothetical protein